ncbi:MAG: Thymidylate kinase [Tenericutes bacterium ADurb.Bin239]|jgi:dTMP kinase|nr:MAG: Thymidylate kinase [Tenericutes bacterium ADurb.Bin239]
MFITFEGPEGSGKTSIANQIVKTLIEKGYDIVYTREPGGTPIAEQIRDVTLDKKNTALDARAEALLIAAGRRQHVVEKIRPALKAGKVVICDRYLDSSLAYQGAARGLGVDTVLGINLFAVEDTFPNLTLLFDLEPKIGFERIKANKHREVNRLDLEERNFYIKVRNAYLELSKKYKNRYRIIDASQSFEKVYEDTLKVILEYLPQK